MELKDWLDGAEEEELATPQQIKKLYAVLHSLGISPKEFKKERGFTSYSKLGRYEISEMIDELEQEEALNGAEPLEEEEVQEEQQPDQPLSRIQEAILEEKRIFHECMRAADDIMNIFSQHDIKLEPASYAEVLQRIATTIYLTIKRRI